MKDKVLCIGCSHLSGAYDKNDAIVNAESWAWHLWKRRGRNETFYTLPCPGQGIMQYSAIIETLKNKNKLSQFKYVIIQLTSEPRINWYGGLPQNYYFSVIPYFTDSNENDFNDGQKMYERYSKSIVLSSGFRKMYEIHEHKFTTPDAKNAWLDISESLYESFNKSTLSQALFPIYMKYIITTLKEHNITPIIFDWWGKTDEQWRSIDDLGIHNNILFDGNSIKQVLTEHNLWKREEQSLGGHLDSIQNKAVMKFLHKEIIEKGLMPDYE
jgi:hypothetical protein